MQAMEDACGDTAVEAFQGWIRHARRYFPPLLGPGEHSLPCR